jgi:hypothetical protein
VNGSPVQITDQGIVAGGSPSGPGPQSQINDAMAKAGYPEVRLTPSIVKTGEDGSFSATTGVLQVIHRDEKLGAQNPQGFQGGGFSVGGAEVSILASRCAPSCGGPLDLSAPPVAHGGPNVDAGPPGGGTSGSYGSSPAGSSSTTAVAPPPTAYTGSEPSTSTEPTTPTAPPPPSDTSTGAPPATSPTAPQSAPQTTPARPSTLAATQLPPDVAGWMRDAFLAGGAALLILILAGTLLIRARAH